jgi:CD109 antigen
MKWWRKPLGVDDQKNPWYGLPNSVDVEMTAYGLLTYIQRGLIQDALPVMKWLITQRNEQGGFASTQVNRPLRCQHSIGLTE